MLEWRTRCRYKVWAWEPKAQEPTTGQGWGAGRLGQNRTHMREEGVSQQSPKPNPNLQWKLRENTIYTANSYPQAKSRRAMTIENPSRRLMMHALLWKPVYCSIKTSHFHHCSSTLWRRVWSTSHRYRVLSQKLRVYMVINDIHQSSRTLYLLKRTRFDTCKKTRSKIKHSISFCHGTQSKDKKKRYQECIDNSPDWTSITSSPSSSAWFWFIANFPACVFFFFCLQFRCSWILWLRSAWVMMRLKERMWRLTIKKLGSVIGENVNLRICKMKYPLWNCDTGWIYSNSVLTLWYSVNFFQFKSVLCYHNVNSICYKMVRLVNWFCCGCLKLVIRLTLFTYSVS